MENETLMLQEPPAIGQRLLFSPEIESEIEKGERQEGRYTLERFKKLRPDAYQDCVCYLAASKPGYEGLRRIARLVGCHWLTVAAVRDEAGETIDTLREKLSRKMLLGVEVLLDSVLESPTSIPPGMRGMVIDQLTKNAELLGNRPTTREEKMERVDIYHHWDEVMEKMLDPGTDVREIGSEIGLGGGKVLTIAAPGAGELGASTGPVSDAQSAVSQGDPLESVQSDTDSETESKRSRTESLDPQPGPDVRNRAGGGSEFDERGAQTRSGSSKQNFCPNAPSPASTP